MNEDRHAILDNIGSILNNQSSRQERADIVAARLREKPCGIIPKRGQLEFEDRIALFMMMAKKVHTDVVRVAAYADIAAIIGHYLRERNLPAMIRTGYDKRLLKIKWSLEKNLNIIQGPSDGNDLVGVSHATAGIAETGSLFLLSGQDNPTTINFLSEHHIVIISAKDIKGDMESTWHMLKDQDGQVIMPRAINFITGPSRSGDIEQKLLLGAHGPRALQIIIVDED